MKNILIYITALFSFLFVACADEDLKTSQFGGESAVNTCRMVLDGSLSVYDGETRAGGTHEWLDGDRLYIRFVNGNDTVLGLAQYSEGNNEWQVSYDGTLINNITQKCEVYYFENATHKSNVSVELGLMSAVYEDTAAYYLFGYNTISLKAHLSPKTGRLRFVSSKPTDFSLVGIKYYIGFDLSKNKFEENYKRRVILNANKPEGDALFSTPYIFGFYEMVYDLESERNVPLGLDVINHSDTSVVYHKDFVKEMMNPGNSGYVSLPFGSNNNGWSVNEFNGGKYFAKDMYAGPYCGDYGVKLNGDGLWSIDYNYYYPWGYRNDYDESYYSGTGSISRTEYDYYYTSYGEEYRMPTKSEVNKMLSLNKYFYGNGDCSYLISDDFNVLLLDKMGYYTDSENWDYFAGENSCCLWTSMSYGSSNAYAVILGPSGYEIKSMPKKSAMGIMGVSDKEMIDNDNDYRQTDGIACVDLGLPSGIKWATCNVGATKPEESGDYYAWGETIEKSLYDISTYKWSNGNRWTMTKYCIDKEYGTVDKKIVLDLEDDVAHVKWSNTWRIPTSTEFEEILNSENCIWEWVTQNGIKGYKVISKKNGNSIFFPVTGYFSGSENVSADYGCYWSSSLYEPASNWARSFSFGYGIDGLYKINSYDQRNYGLSVRPVCE